MDTGHAARSMASSVCSTPGVPFIDPAWSNFLMGKFREFFVSRGYYEVWLQHWLDRLCACEDPETVGLIRGFAGEDYALPQTCQMRQEQVLLGMKEPHGIFHLTYSYRDEKEISDRHKRTFPLLEFEAPADRNGYTELIDTCKSLLQHLGFTQFYTITYADACKRYRVTLITKKEEKLLEKDFGQVVFLTHFPVEETFFNMRRDPKDPNHAFKLDVIVGGQEAIGSAERAVLVEAMRKEFYASNGGRYHKRLFELFGRQEVETELERYLAHKFFPRYGGGIGLIRLIQAMEKYGLLPEPVMSK